ncbi:nucleoplasmin-like protein ANO39 isoform X1 [Mizuhopecten yessoensis]|uniref:nucleoplasmin-like protein ANO39 isoform X1 n=1 Tax=Mizuhopecten yessoensis TaxID=6573 RepID=UPI000B458096|nr:nucleoplasmin-like protein ANO39 isoform X1 [Mizuhopecten yessoensis]
MNDVSREYFWGCVLNKDNPKVTWTFEEEEEDTDFLIHTLFLKQAVLGQAALKDERNLVTVETKNFDNEQIKHPVVSLTLGTNDMCNLDLSFGHENPVVFELVEGAGPVHLTAQQLVEMPDEGNISQDESCTETEEDEEELLEEKEPAKTKKRKASSSKGPTKSKKGKMEVSKEFECIVLVKKLKEEDMEEDEEEDDEDEEEDEEEEEESEEESSPEKSSKKKKKAKETKANPRGKGKMTKASPVRGKAKKSRKV